MQPERTSNRFRPYLWSLLLAPLALGLAAGTLIGFAADRSTTTFTSIRIETEAVTTTEVMTVTKTVAPDPPNHSVQVAEAENFGATYCEMHEAEIMEDVISESGQLGKTTIIGERFGANARAAEAIADACYLVLPMPGG